MSDVTTVISRMNAQQTPGSIWDKNEPNSIKGLHLRVLPSGRRAFYLLYTTRAGRRRCPKIGDVPGTKLSEARDRARIIKGRVAVGEDPKGEWDQKRAEKTIMEAYRESASGYWASDRFEKSGRLKEVISIFTRSIESEFGKRKLSEITPLDVKRWHADIPSGVYANRALEVLSRIYTLQIEDGWGGKNPCAGVKANVERKRRRYATPEELKQILEKLYGRLDQTGYHRSGAIFLLALVFTGARPKSLEQALWSQLIVSEDKGHGILVFSGKGSADSGEQESVVLPKQILSLLGSGSGNTRIFTGFQSWRSVWNQIRGEVGCTDLWARDLRRTFATVGLSSGLSLSVIGETLNHKSNQTTKLYAKAFDAIKIETTNQIASKLEELFSPKEISDL